MQHRRFGLPLGLMLFTLAIAGPSIGAPEFLHRGTVFLDPVALGGDNDRNPEPGETFNLLLTLNNEGDDLARSITASLTSSNPLLTVAATPASVSFPDMPVGAWGTGLPAHFRLTADPTIPCGTAVRMTLNLRFQNSTSTALTQALPFLIFVGQETVIEYEDFDQGPGGWDRDALSSTAISGQWIVAGPQAYTWGTEVAQPARDVTYPDTSCFYTGQNLNPGTPEVENVDAGRVVLLSRVYDLAGRSNVYLSYHRWFYTDDPAAGDSYEVQISNDDGFSWVSVERITARQNIWFPAAVRLDALITPFTALMRIRVLVEDAGAASVCEGAIDNLKLASFSCFDNPLTALLSNDSPAIVDDVDPACTDADGIPDAGETIDYSVVVRNDGNAQAGNTRAVLQTPLPPAFTLLSTNPVFLGVLADNGGSAVATWTLKVDSAVTCQTGVTLTVDTTADPPYSSVANSYDETLEQDVVQPRNSYYDDFDSALPPWSLILYGTVTDWALQQEDCTNHPPGSTPAFNFWYAGSTGFDPTDCSVTPYGANNDGAVRSPRIDTGYANPELLELHWNQLLTLTPGDADYAEVYIDHDDDGIFSLVARYQGLVTTNGDTLDPAVIDLPTNPAGADLSGATRFVTLEFRFISNATGGGGSPLALGWIFDNVELVWTDATGRKCDVLTCGVSCVSTPNISAAKTTICTVEDLDLVGSSVLTGCPAPGVAVYEWFREGLPIGTGTPTLNITEPAIGSFDYRLDVSCSTLPLCKQSALITIDSIDCPGCVASANIGAAPNTECAGTPVPLDAGASSLVNCPAPGVITYQWNRDGLPIPGPLGTAPIYTVTEPTAGSYSYRVDVGCSTDLACTDSQTHAITFDPDGPPVSVGNTLRGRKAAANVELSWTDPQPLAVGWNVHRGVDKRSFLAQFNVTSRSYIDVGAIGGSNYFYAIRAESCSGLEGP